MINVASSVIPFYPISRPIAAISDLPRLAGVLLVVLLAVPIPSVIPVVVLIDWFVTILLEANMSLGQGAFAQLNGNFREDLFLDYFIEVFAFGMPHFTHFN